MREILKVSTASTANLIKYGDGQCGAWANFLVDCFNLNRINAEFVSVKAILDEFILVNDYEFKDLLHTDFYSYAQKIRCVVFPSVSYYSRQRQVITQTSDGSFFAKDYSFVDTSMSAYDRLGAKGHNNLDPFSTFSDHAVVRVLGEYFDPSYGVRASSLSAWEKISISGFMPATTIFQEGIHIYKIRKQSDILDELIEI